MSNNLKFEIRKFDEELSDKWEEFNFETETSTFLTSIPWINFQKSLGKKIDQYLIYLEEEIVGNIFIEIAERKVSRYAYTPYGPVINWTKINDLTDYSIEEETIVEAVYGEIKGFFETYIREHNLNLFKIDPLLEKEYGKDLVDVGFKKSLSPGQAKDTWIMDISEAPEEVLMKQKKDTRYYIRRGEKQGIKIFRAKSEDEIEEFMKLMGETQDRQEFQNYNKEYFLKQFQYLNNFGMAELFLAEYKGKFISAAWMNFYKDTVNYAHGASTSDTELSKLASPYFLHWSIMMFAKEKGYKKYNFWGVVPKGIDHPWRGLSDFKMKFEGKLVSYTGTYELGKGLRYLKNRLADKWAFRKDRY